MTVTAPFNATILLEAGLTVGAAAAAAEERKHEEITLMCWSISVPDLTDAAVHVIGLHHRYKSTDV